MIRPEQSTDVPGIREYSFLIREALSNGLPPDARVARNMPYAETMRGLRPLAPNGAVTPDAVTFPFTNGVSTIDWTTTGIPHLHAGERWWYLDKTAMYSVNPTTFGLTSSVTGITAGGPWQAVSFLGIPFASNGTTFVYNASKTTALTVQALGKHQNRLLLGGMAGTVFSSAVWLRVFAQWKLKQQGDRFAYTSLAFDDSWVLFGARGGETSDTPFGPTLALLGLLTTDNQTDIESHIMSALERREWGLAPLRHPGTVQAFHELSTGALVFGQMGVSRLTPDGDIYMEQPFHRIGIGGRGCVAGDLDECVFIDSQSELWRVRGGNLERLDFNAYIDTLTLSSTVIAFDPAERTYTISDGTTGYILTPDGKLGGPLAVFPTSLARSASGLIGIVHDTRELVANNGFDASTGWTTGSGWVISGGTLNGTTASTSTTRAIAATDAVRYTVRYTITRSAGSVVLKLGTASGTTRSTSGTFSDTITCSGGTGLSITGTGFTGTVDNVSVIPYYADIEFVSTPLDQLERGTKHLTVLQIAQDGLSSLKGGCYYRTDDSGSFVAGPMSQASPNSGVQCWPRVSFADAKCRVTAKAAGDARLERIEFRYNAQDKTFVRGTKGMVEAG